MNGQSPVLQVEGVSKSFGGLRAVSKVSFDVNDQVIKALIGPNGAGKTTLFNLISGILSPSSGKIRYAGKAIGGSKPYFVASRGIARTFQIVRLFREMTVMENVMMGAQTWSPGRFWDALFHLPSARKAEAAIREAALEWLAFVGLSGKASERAANLPFGDQRMVELARALAARPSLLLLDEPASGLNDAERNSLAGLLASLRERGMTVLLVEHNMDLVMNISDEIVVLNLGEKIAEGSPSQIRRQAEVIAAYLGEETHA